MFPTTSRVVAAVCMALLAGNATAAEKTVFAKVVPTDVTWGEISVADGPAIRVSSRDDVEYPFSLAVACDQHARREAQDDGAGGTIVTPRRRRGAIYLAADPAGGRKAWKAALEKLHTRLEELTPETFGTFAQTFSGSLVGADPLVEGAFKAIVCVTVEGQSDQAFQAVRRLDSDGDRFGTSGLTDPAPVCSRLAASLDGEPPADVLATRFEVRAQREESLVVRDAAVSGARHAAWPAGAGIEHAEAPRAANAYSNSGRTEQGAAWSEELRPARNDGPAVTRKPYVLKATSAASSIAPSVLDADALLTRWTWRIRDSRLGAEPAASDRQSTLLDVAFLFTAAHGTPDEDGFERAVTRDFAASDQRRDPTTLMRLVSKHQGQLGTDAMYAVFCDPAKPREAIYCVASACARVVNAEEFCRALAGRLERE